jgi:hypothetical protein
MIVINYKLIEQTKNNNMNANINLSLKNFNKLKRSLEAESNIISQMTKSLSFGDEAEIPETTLSEDDSQLTQENYENIIENINKLRGESIKEFLEDKEISKKSSEIFKSFKTHKKSNKEFSHVDIKEIIDKLNSLTSKELEDKNLLFICLIQLLKNINFDIHSIDFFVKNFLVNNYVNLLNSNLITEKSLYIFLHICNNISENNLDFQDDLFSYQMLFLLARLIPISTLHQIKLEILVMSYRIFLNNQGSFKVKEF